MKILILLSLFVSSVAFAKLEVGQMAPDFSLKGHDGKTYKLSELKGQYVVLEWFNNDCPYVDKHYNEKHRNMQTLQDTWIKKAKKHAKKKEKAKAGAMLSWFAVASSAEGKEGHLDAKKAKEIRDKERKAKMTAILLDKGGKVGQAYEAKVTPHMYIIDPTGKLVYNGAIDDKPSARVSTVKGAKNYVTAALTSLFAGEAVAEPVTKPYGCSVKY
jgi:peroxiredoxin